MSENHFLEPEFYTIDKKKFETSDTFTFELLPPNGKKIGYLPGQFNMLYAFGIGEVPISISGDSNHSKGYIHTIKIVGNVTQALSRLEDGEKVGVRGPFGTAWPLQECQGKDLVIMTGGIGLAPLRPVIYTILQNRNQYRNVAVLYGAREPNEILYAEELNDWKQRLDGHVYITVDYAKNHWNGNVGVVTKLISRIPFDLEHSMALLCGPEIMLRFSIGELKQRKMKNKDIYLAMERNMKCAIGQCGRCQYVSNFICKDGSILSYDKVEPFLAKKEI